MASVGDRARPPDGLTSKRALLSLHRAPEGPILYCRGTMAMNACASQVVASRTSVRLYTLIL